MLARLKLAYINIKFSNYDAKVPSMRGGIKDDVWPFRLSHWKTGDIFFFCRATAFELVEGSKLSLCIYFGFGSVNTSEHISRTHPSECLKHKGCRMWIMRGQITDSALWLPLKTKRKKLIKTKYTRRDNMIRH